MWNREQETPTSYREDIKVLKIIDENGDEQLAFHDVRSVWKFIAEHVTDEKITIYPRLKAKCRESGNLLCDEDNPNPSTPEME